MLPLSAERYRTEQTGCQIRKAIPVAGTVADRDPEFMGALFQETGFRDIRRGDQYCNGNFIQKYFRKVFDSAEIQQIGAVVRNIQNRRYSALPE